MHRITIAIIGAGPWGLAVLDRLISKALSEPQVGFDIALVDPSQPGPGMHNPDQASYLLLNTITGQVNSFSAKHFNDPELSGALTFLEWVQQNIDSKCSPNSFLPRKTFGEYLKFVYTILKKNLPENVKLTEYLNVTSDLQICASGKLVLTGSNDLNLSTDHVFICTGHGLPVAPDAKSRENTLLPYPPEALHSQISPGMNVGLMGMGLAAVDVISALTEGLGGSFEDINNGNLQYVPSGKEPVIFTFSRTGTPFSCRPSSSLDLSTRYQPLFCHETTLATGRELDFRSDVLPQIEAEMWAAYSIRHALLTSGEQAEKQQRSVFEKLGPSDTSAYARTLHETDSYFDPVGLLLGAPKTLEHKTVAMHERIRDRLRHDVSEAEKGEAGSPFKHGIEILRVVRDFIRSAVNYQRLSPSSQIDFFTVIAPRISQLIVGPPLSRGREWLALIDAGILRLDLGANPELHRNTVDCLWRARSRCDNQSLTVRFDQLIQGYVPNAMTGAKGSTLMTNLINNGICALIGSQSFRSLRVDKVGRPIDATGLPVAGISFLGMPTEGSSYFNHYLPSPRSRAQAFEQADIAIQDMLNTARQHDQVDA